MADTPAKLRAFAAEWFPLLEYGLPTDGGGFEETLRLASDTRDLMLLVLELRRMAEEDDCSREGFERLGVRFEEDSSGEYEGAAVYYLASSEMLDDDGRYPVFPFSTEEMASGGSCSAERALKFASLVNDSGIDPSATAKEAGIAQATALNMLERNDIQVNLAQ